MIEHHETNRLHWNQRAIAHYKHPEYMVEEFIKGRSSLHDLEEKEVGDVNGKTLLHLQCHFGLDTLSWARKGATVTGIDISDDSIELANKLKSQIGIDSARFIRSNLYDLTNHLDEQLDIVFTSYGALWWMSDIKKWAQIAARYVKPGGFFYISEGHPFFSMFDEHQKIFEPYFNQGAEVYENEADYCDEELVIEKEIGWRWPIGEIVTALAQAGLRIEFLHEQPVCSYNQWPTMVEIGDTHWWKYKDSKFELPMNFSLKASK